MEFSGREEFTQPPAELWDRLTDMQFMARCLPNVERVEAMESDRFVCRVRPKLAFLTGSQRVSFSVVEQVPPATARLRIENKGIGARAVVETQMELSGLDAGTELTWQATVVELGGLLKSVSRGLIEGAAKRIIDDAWAGVRRELGET